MGAELHARIAQLVERDLAKVEVASSNLVSRSKMKQRRCAKQRLCFLTSLLRDQPEGCRDGGIGRHARLKILWTQVRAGSIPAPGTKLLMEALAAQ